jgi:hypothetical protein
MTQYSDAEDDLKSFVIDMPVPFPIKDVEDETASKISNPLGKNPGSVIIAK